MNRISDKTEGIPIGLENKVWNRTDFQVIDKMKLNLKTKLLYLNFSLHTNQSRTHIMNQFLNKGFEKNENQPWNKYMEELSRYKFAVSPEGNGVDCHRTWECLYLGVIPIVKKSICMSFFGELPILFVDDYNIITKEYLEQKYNEFKKREFSLDKLNLDYWRNILIL
jgi:hypothetical protein